MPQLLLVARRPCRTEIENPQTVTLVAIECNAITRGPNYQRVVPDRSSRYRVDAVTKRSDLELGFPQLLPLQAQKNQTGEFCSGNSQTDSLKAVVEAGDVHTVCGLANEISRLCVL